MYNFNTIGEQVTIDTPAKINLHLAVGKKREDGYHSITSIFQLISLFDIIHVRRVHKSNYCTINGLHSVPSYTNTMYRAYEFFRDSTGLNVGIEINIEKRIPAAAGLGGGSSDAAAVLHGLNILYNTNYSYSQLASIGVKIGSDIPFFCYDWPLALVQGRGEEIERLSNPKTYHGVLIFPNIEIKTEDAYRLLDARRINRHQSLYNSTADIIEDYRNNSLGKWRYVNSFSSVMCDEYPSIKAIWEELYSLGAPFISLTGSGSALYGLFYSEKDVIEASEWLRAKNYRVWKIKTLERKPSAIVK